MILRKPTLDDKDMLMDYIQEHYNNGEYSISASNMLPVMEYSEWVNKLKEDEIGVDLDWGMSETYILVDKDKVIGMLNIRYNPSDEIRDMYGHIGYGVRPSERRKRNGNIFVKRSFD